jgi:hypothetical protein
MEKTEAVIKEEKVIESEVEDAAMKNEEEALEETTVVDSTEEEKETTTATITNKKRGRPFKIVDEAEKIEVNKDKNRVLLPVTMPCPCCKLIVRTYGLKLHMKSQKCKLYGSI